MYIKKQKGQKLMKKFLLLTTTILLSSASVYAACNPNLPACQCSYPEMKNGIISCSETGTNYMPDGSCCPTDNYCESTELGKQCSSAEQTCDTTKGCVEEKTLEAKCKDANGTFVNVTSGSFCLNFSSTNFNWYDANEWCFEYGMSMPTVLDVCPSWSGSTEGCGVYGEKPCCSKFNPSVGPGVGLFGSNATGLGNAICH